MFTEPLVAAISDDDVLASRESVSMAELATRPFVLYPRDPRPSFADTVIALCRQAGFEPTVATETMDLQTALGLVAVGAGVSIIPQSIEQAHRTGMRCLPLTPPTPMTTLSLNWRRDNRSEVLRNFVRLATDA